MTKFNSLAARPAVGNGPVTTGPAPTTVTHLGAPAYERGPRGDLFVLAVSNMVGEGTFHERPGVRDGRFNALARQVAVEDVDGDWFARFVGWLRGDANMRSAALVAACQGVHARLTAGRHGGNRAIIAAAIARADEPGELLAYWMSTFGRTIPKPVKRGVADAVASKYNEYALLKYDTPSRGVRFGDVVELTHPTPDPTKPWQGSLFEYALDRRHGRDQHIPADLPTVAANAELRRLAAGDPTRLLDTGLLRDAGMTWEDALSMAGGRVDSARLWSALIPSMGYMALLRNLRNFDVAGVPDDVAAKVAAGLADPGQVARSRQLPMRFLSAYRAVPSLRWGHALEQALHHSLSNVPALAGKTLIMVDTSGSMMDRFSKDGTLRRWDAAVLFGLALAMRCAHADVVSFSTRISRFTQVPGESLLRAVERWRAEGHFHDGGTYTAMATKQAYDGHDRVVILTDEQAGYGGDPGAVLPANVPLYGFNLAGYAPAMSAWGNPNRVQLAGLNDSAFRLIPLIESGRNGTWPF